MSVGIDVRGGIHDGARSAFRDREIAIVGAALDCDLRLTDTGISPHHAALAFSGERLVVRPMDGLCAVNGKTLSAGQSAAISDGDSILLKGADVWLTMTSADIETDDAEISITERPRSRFSLRARLCAFAIFAALGIGVGATQLRSKDLPIVPIETRVANVLVDLDVARDLSVIAEGDVVTIRGVVSNAKSSALEVSLQSLPATIINKTQSVGLLLEQVRSVYRINGYHAELKYLGDGNVQVTNLDGENSRIQQIAGLAKDDISALSELTFAAVSDADRKGAKLSVYSSDPNKRLTTIIDGDTAYVATTDGGRYFVGSVLPGGLVLRDISADGIQVDDNGEIHWLAL